MDKKISLSNPEHAYHDILRTVHFLGAYCKGPSIYPFRQVASMLYKAFHDPHNKELLHKLIVEIDKLRAEEYDLMGEVVQIKVDAILEETKKALQFT